MNTVYLSIWLCHLQFFKSMTYSFLSMGLLPPWLDLFQGILFHFFDAMVNEIVFLISLSDSLLLVIAPKIYIY